MHWRIRGAVSPGCILVVSQRHVASAQRIHLAQHGKTRPDRMAALHAEQRSDPPLAHDSRDIIGAIGHFQVLRITRDQPPGNVDLFQHRLHGLCLGQIGGNEDGPELRADPPLAQTGKIGLHRARDRPLQPGIARVEEVEGTNQIAETRAQLDRRVIMAIPHRRCIQRGTGKLFRGRACGNGGWSGQWLWRRFGRGSCIGWHLRRQLRNGDRTFQRGFSKAAVLRGQRPGGLTQRQREGERRGGGPQRAHPIPDPRPHRHSSPLPRWPRNWR